MLPALLLAAAAAAQPLGGPMGKAPAAQAAIAADDLPALKLLLTRKNVDAQLAPPQFADTPLSYAAMLGRKAIVQWLVEDLKADLYRTHRSGTLSMYIPAEAATRDVSDQAHRETAAYLLPRYSWYEEYLEAIKAAGPYKAEALGWPRDAARFFFVGERHGVAEFPEEVGRLLEALPVTHFATEFLNQSEQGLVDDWAAGKATDEEFKAKTSHPRMFPAYAAAKKKGIPVIALERIPVYSDREEAMKHDLTEERNVEWMKLLSTLGELPAAKILVYDGQAHSNYLMKSKPVSEMAAARFGGKAVIVAQLIGGSKAMKNGPTGYDLASYMADKAGRSGETFLLSAAGRSKALTRAMACDFFIHLGHSSQLAP